MTGQEVDAPNEIELCQFPANGKPAARVYACGGDEQHYASLRIEAGSRAMSMTPEEWLDIGTEVDTLRMQLAACGVVAMCNTPESAAKHRLSADSQYRCASYNDVEKLVDREMALRAKVAELSKPERETSLDERCTWGECPSCGAPHGQRCNPDVGLSIGYAVGGGPPRDGVHVSRIQRAPLRVRVVPA